jgi:riboflavin biosynthesis pyrimidine reductase
VTIEVSFETLFEDQGLPRFQLPETLEDIYGSFGLDGEVVYANFVATVDGVADLPNVSVSSPLISQRHPADRFAMGLLRASADAVVIGAGTFRAHSGPWTAESAYPDCADLFADLRARIGASPRPKQVVVTSSGAMDGAEKKLQNTLVVTTAAAAPMLDGVSVNGLEVVEVGGPRRIDVQKVMSLLSERGYSRILTEGGPRLMGTLVEAGVVDELFLTVSPLVAGGGLRRNRATLAAGVDILPAARMPARLLSVRRSDSYLFLRYSLEAVTGHDR